ncbi:E3 ubiquitin-protein ligase At3g02290-like isoform X2 [Magnolia sinica]|uniref:E3 ubiquitin-protein ligase At3g02290-like isoform X2 n=1 Tax=Magnolia sinica TaxID=86752 RepID=UPI00265A6F9C|nr:E3 ubiquitin-protein ligase At3g02290-like isoform X2 [Magnolia sinica]
MGAVCSCLQVEDICPNSDIYGHCICISCFVQQFLNVYTALFQRGEMHAVPSSIQGVNPLASAGLTAPSVDNSPLDTYRAPMRPLPYDADPRCSRLQRDGWLSRHGKASSHFNEETEPLRSSSYSGSLSVADKWTGSSMKHQSAKVTSGDAYILSSSEDEDVCPTCLEEYTPENPKIMTRCSHHFHLGCIYEWMERSESCPICGKAIGITCGS